MARSGGHATVTCAVGWRCVGSEHRVPRRPSIRPRGCLNVLSRSHPRYSWNCKLCAISCFGTSLGRGLHCKTCHGSRSLRSLSCCALRDIAPSTMHSRDRPQHSHPHLLTLDRLLVTRAFKQRSNSVQTAFKQWLGRKCLNSSNGIISQVLEHLSVQTVGMSVQTLEQRAWWCCWP